MSNVALPSVPDYLQAAAQTFRERNGTYGDSYKTFGPVMMSLFPNGLKIETAEDWNRLGVLIQAISKLHRYTANFATGGHQDSAHDLIVQAAMLEEMSVNHQAK